MFSLQGPKVENLGSKALLKQFKIKPTRHALFFFIFSSIFSDCGQVRGGRHTRDTCLTISQFLLRLWDSHLDNYPSEVFNFRGLLLD